VQRAQRLTVRQLAEYLDIPISSAYRGLQNGQIPARRVGSRYIIFRSAIEQWSRCGEVART
jgi:excisionase family DNA binding protein